MELLDKQFKQKKKIFTLYSSRLEHELKIIEKMNFPGYFLIVADFIKWAKEKEIPVGPGRGSGVGSLIAWSLGITGLNPLRFGLIFERFLNPERISIPDFDIDFCPEGRDEVIQYVRDKYGEKASDFSNAMYEKLKITIDQPCNYCALDESEECEDGGYLAVYTRVKVSVEDYLNQDLRSQMNKLLEKPEEMMNEIKEF